MVAKNTRPEEGVLRKKEAHFDILGLFWTGKGVFEAKLALPIGFFSVFLKREVKYDPPAGKKAK